MAFDEIAKGKISSAYGVYPIKRRMKRCGGCKPKQRQREWLMRIQNKRRRIIFSLAMGGSIDLSRAVGVKKCLVFASFLLVLYLSCFIFYLRLSVSVEISYISCNRWSQHGGELEIHKLEGWELLS